MARRDAAGVTLPGDLHFRYLRDSWPEWYLGLSEVAARRALFAEAQLLHRWYHNMLDSDAPYLDAARGYVAVYMPRGYHWLARVVERAGDGGCLRGLVRSARSVLVLGCGPAPELWSLASYLGPEAVVTLVDRNMAVWERFIRGFTEPLVREARGLFAAEFPSLRVRTAVHDSELGLRCFDLVIAQQLLNEVAALRSTSYQGEKKVLSAVLDWHGMLLRPGGAIVLLDHDPRDKRLPAIEEALPPGSCRRGSLAPTRVRCAAELERWLSGSWGNLPVLDKAATKYLLAYA